MGAVEGSKFHVRVDLNGRPEKVYDAPQRPFLQSFRRT
jgi:hypothetical protein